MPGRGGGRGAYYREKYGGRGRGRSRDEHQQQGQFEEGEESDGEGLGRRSHQARGTLAQMARILHSIDGRSYKAYNDIKGAWSFADGGCTLQADKIQTDPFAPPSRFTCVVASHLAAFDSALWRARIRRTALCDYLTRSFAAAVSSIGAHANLAGGSWAAAKGGGIEITQGGQHVLERTSVLINDKGDVEARFTVSLPASGRTVLGKVAARNLTDALPKCVEAGLCAQSQDMRRLEAHVRCVEDTQALRDALPGRGLVAFVGDGSVLPRAAGNSEAPLPDGAAVPFTSPPSLAVEVDLPSGRRVRGWGIRPGVTLIVGGGFHGKSTVLKALEAGYTNKVPGDGRELVVTTPSACKIRAEDGRRVEGVDISPFISNLPFEKDTSCFRTDDASGSTSQAANIMEALEIGSELLLIDEDTAATNFMIRDERMQALVSPDKEPITPLVSRVRALAASGASLVLVVGGSGAFFGVADAVVAMDCFAPRDVTARAQSIAREADRLAGIAPPPAKLEAFRGGRRRAPTHVCGESGGSLRPAKVPNDHTILFAGEELDLRCVEQIFERSQTRGIAHALEILTATVQQRQGAGACLSELLADLDARLDAQGLDALSRHRVGNLARPRKLELAAALNRLRTVRVQQLR